MGVLFAEDTRTPHDDARQICGALDKTLDQAARAQFWSLDDDYRDPTEARAAFGRLYVMLVEIRAEAQRLRHRLALKETKAAASPMTAAPEGGITDGNAR